MVDTNYIGTIVKILENPSQRTLNGNITITEFRAELPQIRNKAIVKLVFWGNLAYDITNYYRINDYIMIEGYLSLRDKLTSYSDQKKLKKVEITVLKIYPFLINSN